ncbi:hypothetical protein ELS19_00020 [Halogeometricum borinquense]|uniref:Uncharacterized protein n=1 Tax=Halogeometricum borinquense TaxID=60847 RepID=A0A482TUZ6_9EURY|nr:hypothetical protein [Halogeometricum borinquense]RYJ19435.1 hypothetical protein ELS19_00020 [Halogeometricum borinquense]
MTDSPLSDLETTDAAPPASNWRPTALSIAVVLCCTAIFGGLLTGATQLWNAVLPAAGGAALLAGAISLAAATAYRPLSRFVAACLLLPASAGVVAGLGYVFAKQLGGTYPVGSVFVVVSLTAAGFGAAAAVRDTLESDALESALAVATVASLPPTFAFVPLAIVRIFEEFSATLYVPVLVPDPVPAAAFPGALVGGVLRFLVAPTHEGPHLFSFALVCYLAVIGLETVLRTYPVADLVRPNKPEAADRVLDPLKRGLTAATTLGTLVVFILGILFLAPRGFEMLPATILDPVTTLAGVDILRVVLFLSGVVGILLGIGSWGLRRFYDASKDELGKSTPSLVAGSAVVIGAFTLHEPVLTALLDAILDVLPAAYAGDVQTQADAVMAFYGGEVVVLGLCAGLLFVAAVAFAVLYGVVNIGVMTDRAAGAAVAGAGLFVASAVAATVGAGTTLVLAGLVGGLIVRDAGTHGVTLGHEIGRLGETRRAELVHLAVTAIVGVVAAIAAVGLADFLGRIPALDGSGLSLALGGAVLGVLFFVVALR